MSKSFFKQLQIPKPDYNLGIGSTSDIRQTALMMIALENILLKEKPELVIVFGDTNSTLAGAIASAKLKIPIAHIEAGMRSFNKNMPEEINRIITDHVSTLHFCSSKTSKNNLLNEGIKSGIQIVGDIMIDAIKSIIPGIEKNQTFWRHLI